MKYLVLVDEGNGWEECGEGPMTQKQAERIAREIRQYCAGEQPVRTLAEPEKLARARLEVLRQAAELERLAREKKP
jgi:hypothetical protein